MPCQSNKSVFSAESVHFVLELPDFEAIIEFQQTKKGLRVAFFGKYQIPPPSNYADCTEI
jgi:hypothetical protein